MPRKPQPRYPWAPLERILVNRLPANANGVPSIARLLGVNRRQVHRWRTEGLTADRCDQLAGRAHLSVWEVWPEWGDDAIAELERECAADDCTARFIREPRERRIYCSDRCKWRVHRRRQLRRPEVQEANRAYNRRYYQEAGDYVRAQQRRRDRARRQAQRSEAA